MYAWPESVAHRGANEVVSCLDHYFKLLEGIDTLMLFLDSCGGQNKNSIVMHFLDFSRGVFNTSNTFFLLVVTHSCLVTEILQKRRRKKWRVERVYISEQWHDIIRSAKKSKPFLLYW